MLSLLLLHPVSLASRSIPVIKTGVDLRLLALLDDCQEFYPIYSTENSQEELLTIMFAACFLSDWTASLYASHTAM